MGKHARTIVVIGAVVVLGSLIAGGIRGWPPPAEAVPTRAPDFVGITHWINSKPLTMQELRGKVVLIDFWAYSCINCLRTLPHVTHWYDKYKDKGFVVVGVHSPEFDFGKHLANVERAVKHFHIHYPVAMDSHMDTWRAWNNRFWPAEYLINRRGQVVLHHFGEGHYLEMENAIRQQLGLKPVGHATMPVADLAGIRSPEMYFGTARQQYLANPVSGGTPTVRSLPADRGRFAPGGIAGIHHYTLPDTLRLNHFALGGSWEMTPQFAQLVSTNGVIRLHFKSGKLYMVASADQPITLQVTVDGKKQPPVTVQASRLYTLFDSNDYRDHIVTIKIPHAGLRAFTFTFG